MINPITPFMRISDFILQYKFVLAFYLIIILVIVFNKHRFEVQAKIIALYRTKFGIKWIEHTAKRFNTFIKNLSYLGVPIGYLGMIIIVIVIFQGIYNLFFIPEAPPSIAAVVPGLPIAGTGITIPFVQGLLAFFIVIVIHEFSHGIVSKANNVPIMSTGFVMFGPIPGAFVEPDEELMKKKIHQHKKQKDEFPWLFHMIGAFLFLSCIYFFTSRVFPVIADNIMISLLAFSLIYIFIILTARYFFKKNYFHLGVFAAGPFSNILTAIFVFLIVIGAAALSPFFIDNNGFVFTKIYNNTPAYGSGLQTFQLYNTINNKTILSVEEFIVEMDSFTPNSTITVGNQTHSYPVTLTVHPENASQAYLGVQLATSSELKPGISPKIFAWILSLLNWIFILSLGLGLANLLPLGPVDGGRMFQVILHMLFGKDKGNLIWTKVAVLLLFIIILLFLGPILRYLFV